MAGPVLIAHHGRAKLVLASVAYLESTTATERADSREALDDVLEMMGDVVLVTDNQLKVVGLSPLARRMIGVADWRNRSAEDLLPADVRPFLIRAMSHVRDSGTPERLTLRLGRNGERLLDVNVQSIDGGLCLVGRDRTASESQVQLESRSRALDEMVSMLGNVAWLRINQRGYVVEASPSFEQISGLSERAYRSVRLSTLFHVGSRVAVGDALERAIETMSTQMVDATLLIASGADVRVKFAISGEMLRVSGTSVMAMLSVVAG